MTVDTIERNRAHLVVIADLAAQAAKHDAEAPRQSVLAIELRQGIAIIERALGAEPHSNPVANAEEEANGAIAAVSDDPASREVDDAERQQLAASGFTGDGEAGSPVLPTHALPASTEPPKPPLAETGEGVRPHALPETVPDHEAPSIGGVNAARVAADANAGGENVTAALDPDTEPSEEAVVSSPIFTSPEGRFHDPDDIEDEDGAQPATEPADDLRRRKQVHQRVKAALDAHPDWTIREIAEHAGCSVSLAGRWVKSIRGPVRPSGQETLGAKLAVLVAERGQVTMREAIDAIGGTPGGIAAAAKRAGITLRKATKEEHAKNTKAGMAAKSSEPLLEKSANPQGLGRAPREDALAVAPKPVIEAPAPRIKQSTSVRFYLRDDLGRYLHQSLESSPTDTGPLMTSNRKWAWFDNERRYEGALRKWPGIASLRREVPQ
ncbi:hypothetical protein XM25_07935 [Devosia sp. H5989]|nr:hypothetical protein XM25_07935 [Devosia sp. H5989]